MKKITKISLLLLTTAAIDSSVFSMEKNPPSDEKEEKYKEFVEDFKEMNITDAYEIAPSGQSRIFTVSSEDNHAFTDKKFARFNVSGDGNCLFYALETTRNALISSIWLVGKDTSEKGQKLRNFFQHDIIENYEDVDMDKLRDVTIPEFKKFLNKYVKDKEYAPASFALAYGFLNNQSVYVWALNIEDKLVINSSYVVQNKMMPIHIFYKQNHFQILVPVTDEKGLKHALNVEKTYSQEKNIPTLQSEIFILNESIAENGLTQGNIKELDRLEGEIEQCAMGAGENELPKEVMSEIHNTLVEPIKSLRNKVQKYLEESEKHKKKKGNEQKISHRKWIEVSRKDFSIQHKTGAEMSRASLTSIGMDFITTNPVEVNKGAMYLVGMTLGDNPSLIKHLREKYEDIPENQKERLYILTLEEGKKWSGSPIFPELLK